jgi:hypothetical protein
VGAPLAAGGGSRRLEPAVAVGLARGNKGIEENWPTGVSTEVEDMGRKTTWASVRLMMLRASDRETRQILYADQVDRYPAPYTPVQVWAGLVLSIVVFYRYVIFSPFFFFLFLFLNFVQNLKLVYILKMFRFNLFFKF